MMNASLLLHLLILCCILGSDAATIVPKRRGNSGHLYSTRKATNSNKIKDKHRYSPSSSFGYQNRTLHAVPQHHGSSLDTYSNWRFASSVASFHHTQATSRESPYWHKRVPRPTPAYDNPTLTASKSIYPEISSVSQSVSGSGTSRAGVSTRTKPVKRSPLNMNPTPAPTSSGSSETTVFINNEKDFALLLPNRPGELISDAESDGVAFCTADGCHRPLPEGFITAAAVSRAPDSSWIQVTGCIDPSKSTLSTSDDGGQFDVRFPNGAKCTFGGYGASFIELVEPSASRFCLRCCAQENDQTNCNSHQDRAGCPVAVPGLYDFPDKGVSCE